MHERTHSNLIRVTCDTCKTQRRNQIESSICFVRQNENEVCVNKQLHDVLKCCSCSHDCGLFTANDRHAQFEMNNVVIWRSECKYLISDVWCVNSISNGTEHVLVGDTYNAQRVHLFTHSTFPMVDGWAVEIFLMSKSINFRRRQLLVHFEWIFFSLFRFWETTSVHTVSMRNLAHLEKIHFKDPKTEPDVLAEHKKNVLLGQNRFFIQIEGTTCAHITCCRDQMRTAAASKTKTKRKK